MLLFFKKEVLPSFFPDLTLILATALWGLAVLITRIGVADAPPVPFLALRFVTAAIAVRALTGARLARITPTELRAGSLLGVAMFAGYALQATGLRTLGAGHAAFISALYVPIVPMLQFLIFRRPPGPRVWAGVALATAGLMLMAGGHGAAPSRGDAFALAGAFATAGELLLMAHFAARVDPRRLAVVECACVCAYAVCLAALTGERLPLVAHGWLLCALGLGCTSAFLQVSSNWAMGRMPVHRAMLIFATEPIWAGLFGALAGERMGIASLAGAGLILAALILNIQSKK